MKPTQEQIELAAAAIANERGGRRGMPPISNVLDMLPRHLRDELMEDARAALEAIPDNGLRDALEESVKLQSHYAVLLNAYDGGLRLAFESADDWIARLKEVQNQKQSMKKAINESGWT
jgi:hypothetical protein